ncbi:MAG: DUF2125 domain-containing protein [Proteobacteria bacterium]|nr:DUF2125 domain-containing protein [Pseudomonadota bacterium]
MSDLNAGTQPVAPQPGDAPPAKPNRRGLYIPFALLGIACAIWSGIWFYAADKAGKIADHFIAREGERGREWVCPNRTVGGFPFRIEIACKRPQLLIRKGGELAHEGSLGALSLNARILSPGHFIAVLAPPFVTRKGSIAEMEMGWKEARMSFRAGLEGISEADVEVSEATWAFGKGDKADIKALAKGFDLHMRRSPGEVPGTDFVGRINDFTFAPLDMLTGSPDPIRLELQATAPGLLPDPRRRFLDVLEEWRQSGRQARVVVFKANKGQANIDLSGVLGLDEAHRLAGNLSGRAKGIEALTGRLSKRGGLDLGGLFDKLGGGQGLPVSLTMNDGVLRYGPFPLTRLDPLY